MLTCKSLSIICNIHKMQCQPILPFLLVSENPWPAPETVCEPRTKGLGGFQTLTLKNVCAVDLTPNYTVILYLFIILKNVKNIKKDII